MSPINNVCIPAMFKNVKTERDLQMEDLLDGRSIILQSVVNRSIINTDLLK